MSWFQPRPALIFFSNHEGQSLDLCGCGQDPNNQLNLTSFQRREEKGFLSLSSEKKEHVGCVFPNMSLYMLGHKLITLEFELLMAVKGVSDKWMSNQL